MDVDLDRIDEMLRILFDASGRMVYLSQQYIKKHGVTHNIEWVKYHNYLRLQGLAEEDEFGVYSITAFGHQVQLDGGWSAYLSRNKQAQEKEEEYKRLSLEYSRQSADATVKSEKSARSSARAAWVAGIVAVLTFLYPFYQLYINGKQSDVNTNQDRAIKELQDTSKEQSLRLKRLDSLVTLLLQSQSQTRFPPPKTSSQSRASKKK